MERSVSDASHPALAPHDTHNAALEAAVHPRDWTNPEPKPRYHLVVIGAGTAGLVTASVAAALGADVALVERGLMGGDCLNVGCVPSKALLAAAKAVHAVRTADQFGVRVTGEVSVDFPVVMERMRRIRAGIAPHDSARRFASLGVDVFLGEARFTGRNSVTVKSASSTASSSRAASLTFGRAVLATGATATVPSVPGLAEAGFLTNETVFSLTELPRRLAVIGAGPIGCELAQAMARFGSDVTVLSRGDRILPQDDPDAAAIVQRRLVAEGVRFHFGASPTRVELTATGRRLTWTTGSGASLSATEHPATQEIEVDQILVAAGRTPNVTALGLEEAGVAYDRAKGVEVDSRLRTSNPRIFAAGDCCSKFKFTHAADFLARTVVRNALFRGRARATALTIPWCTYTDPELAHVGLTPAEAEAEGTELTTFDLPLSELDRARTDSTTEGFVRAHVRQGTDQLVGVTIVGPHAGDLIATATTLLTRKIGLGAFANVIHPYPTLADGLRKLGDQANKRRLTPWSAWLLKSLIRWTI